MDLKYDLEEFTKLVKYYFKNCEEDRKIFPDLSGMKNALDISDEEYAEYERTEGYDKVCRWALNRRKSWLMRKMVMDKSAAMGCMNALKQPENGGLTDKPVEKTDRKVIVKLEGLDGMKL